MSKRLRVGERPDESVLRYKLAELRWHLGEMAAHEAGVLRTVVHDVLWLRIDQSFDAVNNPRDPKERHDGENGKLQPRA